MNGRIIAGIIGLSLVPVYVIWQRWELTKFMTSSYTLYSKKVKAPHRMVVLADLHGFSYGPHNSRLLEAVKREQPEVILIAGDMMVSRYTETYGKALDTLKELVKIAPVFYGFGNHESRAAQEGLAVTQEFQEYLKKVEQLGVQVLRNASSDVVLGRDVITVSGLEIDLAYYQKGHVVPMSEDYIRQCLGRDSGADYEILLAHNPVYAKQYAGWGADLTLCGHNHGGLVRIPGVGSVISPQFQLFPSYSEGCHSINGKNVIISRGLGTHTFHVRIFNRAELVSVKLLPQKERGKSRS